MKLPTSLLIALCAIFTLTLAIPEADPDRLNDALQAAAKSASFKKAASGPKSASKVKFHPAPNPTPNLGGLGVVGGFGVLQPGPNYGAQCRKKNAKMATVINTFCSKHTPITVPSKYTSKGWCGYGEKQMTAQVDNSQHGTVVWCAKIGSKKSCNVRISLADLCFGVVAIGRKVLTVVQPATLEKKKCISKLMEVCAKGGARGIGVAKDGDCHTYRTGRVDYTKVDLTNPFRGWTNV